MRSHVWKIAADGSSLLDLTPGDRDVPPFAVGGSLDFDVSPDGREFVYPSNPDPVEAISTNADLWLAPFTGGGSPKNLTAGNAAYDGSPKFSPDGKWIAYRSQARPGFEADRVRLLLYDRTSGGTRSLTESFDASVEDFSWAPDSRSIYFLSEVQARVGVFRVPIARGAPVELWRNGTAAQLVVSRDGSRLFFSASTLTRPAEIFALESAGKAAARSVVRPNEASSPPCSWARSRSGGRSPPTGATSRRGS